MLFLETATVRALEGFPHTILMCTFHKCFRGKMIGKKFCDLNDVKKKAGLKIHRGRHKLRVNINNC